MYRIPSEEEIIERWDNTLPLISICSITYNHENFVSETLDSFLMQESAYPYEILISDDCSPDKTQDIINQYVKKYPNIIKSNLREKNVGMMVNFIENIARANGKYIALCEGDDYWTDENKLQKQVDFLEKNDDFVITYSNTQAFNENGLLEKNYGGSSFDLSKENLQKCIAISTPTVCFRNLSILKEFPQEGLTSKFGDLFLWSILGNYGKGKYLPNIKKTMYRVHDGGVFSKQSQAHRRSMWLMTAFSLYMYYYRIKNQELSNYFLKQVIKSGIGIIGTKEFLKMILRKFVRNNND